MRISLKKPNVLPLTQDCTDLKKYEQLDSQIAAIVSKNPQMHEVWQKALAQFEPQLLKGKIFTKSFIEGALIHEKSVGLLNMSHDAFMELMPANHWGIHQHNYLGGEIKVLQKDAVGRVILQRERMCLKTFLSGLLKYVIQRVPIDLTQIEKINYLKDATILQWANYYSNNDSVEVDVGVLKFIARQDGRTQVEFESEHRIKVLPINNAIFEKYSQKITAGILKDFFKKTIERFQDIAQGKTEPLTPNDFRYK